MKICKSISGLTFFKKRTLEAASDIAYYDAPPQRLQGIVEDLALACYSGDFSQPDLLRHELYKQNRA